MSTELKEKQIQTAEMMARGYKQSEIARRLDLTPETLTRWKKNPQFMMEIERVKRIKREQTQDHVRHLAEASFDAIWSELRGGPKQFQAALQVLKMLGIDNVPALDAAIKEQHCKDGMAAEPAANSINIE